MFDLTLDKDDKDTYIVDVHVNDNGTYTVKFVGVEKKFSDFLFIIFN